MIMSHKTNHLLASKADALAFINAQPRTALFYIHVAIDMPIVGQDARYLEDGFSGAVEITRAAALKLIDDGFRDTAQKRGAALPIAIRTWDKRTTVWIG
jgi:hypothetical protein